METSPSLLAKNLTLSTFHLVIKIVSDKVEQEKTRFICSAKLHYDDTTMSRCGLCVCVCVNVWLRTDPFRCTTEHSDWAKL